MVDPQKAATIGIDLGHKDTCIAHYSENKAAIISEKKTGETLMPSLVAYTKKGVITGTEALKQIGRNSENTIM